MRIIALEATDLTTSLTKKHYDNNHERNATQTTASNRLF